MFDKTVNKSLYSSTEICCKPAEYHFEVIDVPWLIGTAWVLLKHKDIAELFKHAAELFKLSGELLVFS